jgi:hypothetical protein
MQKRKADRKWNYKRIKSAFDAHNKLEEGRVNEEIWKRNSHLSQFFWRWTASRFNASLYSKTKPNRNKFGFCSTNFVISVSILFPRTVEFCKSEIAPKINKKPRKILTSNFQQNPDKILKSIFTFFCQSITYQLVRCPEFLQRFLNQKSFDEISDD